MKLNNHTMEHSQSGKWRAELKYLITYTDYTCILEELKTMLDYDANCKFGKPYTVSSMYYDSPNLTFFYDKLNGENSRCKVRLRKYKHADESDYSEIVSLEIKRKENTLIKKEILSLNRSLAEKFMNECSKFLSEFSKLNKEQSSTLAKFTHLKNKFDLKKCVEIRYERLALILSPIKRFRITFDFNLRYSRGNDIFKKVTSPDTVIMEIKHEGIAPKLVLDVLSRHNCQQTSFSKYGICVANQLEITNGMDY